MTPYITTNLELKNFIFRKLGAEAHQIEISDQNWNDIYNESLKYIYEYFADSVNEKTILVSINNVRDITLDSTIYAVKEMLVSKNDLGLYLAYPGISPIFDFVSSGDRGAVSSYLATMSYIREIRQTFQKFVHFKFNSESKRLIIGEEVTSAILVILEAETESNLFNSDYFHKVLEAKCWKAWMSNTGKYKEIQIGNGLTLNRDDMKENYNSLMEEIQDSIENDEYSFLGPIRLNSI